MNCDYNLFFNANQCIQNNQEIIIVCFRLFLNLFILSAYFHNLQRVFDSNSLNCFYFLLTAYILYLFYLVGYLLCFIYIFFTLRSLFGLFALDDLLFWSLCFIEFSLAIFVFFTPLF